MATATPTDLLSTLAEELGIEPRESRSFAGLPLKTSDLLKSDTRYSVVCAQGDLRSGWTMQPEGREYRIEEFEQDFLTGLMRGGRMNDMEIVHYVDYGYRRITTLLSGYNIEYRLQWTDHKLAAEMGVEI